MNVSNAVLREFLKHPEWSKALVGVHLQELEWDGLIVRPLSHEMVQNENGDVSFLDLV